MALGWVKFYDEEKSMRAQLQQGFVITTFLCIIFVTFILQALVCFQRDILFLNEEICVPNVTIDVNRVCCQHHIVTAFIVPDLLIFTSYLFGIYLFSSAETEHLSKLAGEVFTKTREQLPKKLLLTIGAYFMAGIAWIISSFVLRVLYLVAFKYWDSEVAVYWSTSYQIEGSQKRALIVFSIIGFFFLDMVYTASIINYAIQSELNVYLLKAISKSVDNKMYPNLDQCYKDISNAECNLRVLNGKTANGASLVIFKLSISAIVALQQLEQLTNGKALLPSNGLALGLIVASLNALVWAAMVVFAFVQASRVTDAGSKLKRSAVHIRSRPLQYSTSLQSDLDSFVLYTQAVKLRATLFGVPVVPWVMLAAVTILCFVLIMLIKTDLYHPYPNL